MKTKMTFLIKQSLKKKIKTKWFLVVNIILVILLMALANMDKIINYFGGDFKNENQIILVDETASMGDVLTNFKTYFEATNNQVGDISKYTVGFSEDDFDTLLDSLEETGNIVIVFQASKEEYITAEMVSFDPIDTISLGIISATLNSIKSEYALANSNIDKNELLRITSPMSVKQTTTNPDLETDAKAKDILATSVMVIFILPFFMLTMLLVQMLGAEINDEKTTRSMEIIISNVSPKAHFASKIISATVFTLFQAILLFLYGGLGFLARFLIGGGISLTEGSVITDGIDQVMDLLHSSGVLASLTNALPLILLLLVINLLAYALLSGILASMTTSLEDFQQLQTPLMIISVLGYYLGIMASFFEGSAFIKVFAMLPFFSAVIAPVIYLLGQIGILELLISLGVVSVTCFLLFRYGLRIYKVGILNYSSKDLWKKMFKSMKKET